MAAADTHRQFAGVPLVKQIENDVPAVEAAAKAADSEELRKLHAKALFALQESGKLLDMLVAHYSGKTSEPRQASDSVIAAMQSASLAAIDLAKSVAGGGK
jgi:hypothetical protein